MSSDKNISKNTEENTGLVFATPFESKEFVNGLDLIEIEKKPFEIYCKYNLFLIHCGIGKANAAMAASYLVWKYNVTCIYNIGAAGSTTTDKKPGELYHINKVVEYDRPGVIKKGLRILNPDILNGYAMASLATQDIPVIEPSHRKEMSKYAGESIS